MARQSIPYTLEPPSYPDPKLAPVLAALRWVQENVTDHSAFAFTGRESLHVKNTDTGADEVQTIATDSGTVTAGYTVATVTVHGVDYTSPHIVWNSTPSQVATGLLAAVDADGTQLGDRFVGGLVGSGGNLPGGTVTITFAGALAGQLIAAITLDNGALTGGTFAVTEGTPGSGDHQLTVHSANDPYNRTADIVQPIGAGTEVILPFFSRIGWRQADGNVWLDGDDTSLYFAVVELPTN